MSMPRYPVYKETGIDWLGTVPEHWRVERFKLSVESCSNGVWGEEASNNSNDVVCIRVADFDRQKLNAAEPAEPTIRNVSDRDIEARSLRCGDLLIEKSGGGEKQPVGAVVLFTGSTLAVCSNFVARMRLAPGMNPSFWRYAHHAAYSSRVNTKSIKQTSGIQNLDQQQYLDEVAAYPPSDEQEEIANFLDRETAKIDALIAEQQRLIELLQEKRQAVISHAVTKGLNPNAPMKDSGVEWLGEVPEHWTIKKASWLFKTEKGKRAQELTQEFCAENEGPFPVFSGQTKDGGIMGVIDSYDFDAGEEGAILCTTVGAKAMSVRRITGKFSLSQNCMVISPKRIEAIPSFFEYGFQPLFKHERALIPDHMQPSFRMEDFNQFWIQVPPAEEQAEIYKYLQEEQQASVELEANISKAIGLLQERRSALISAAVTGQIDVRGLVPEVAEQ